jgi:ABC-2 type transport system permease protein
MKTWIYSKRNLKELISDPISLIFTIGLPAFLMIFMISLNQSLNVNVAFNPENFVPSTIIFSYGFLTMFTGMLVSKDRCSSFLSRMFVSPLKAKHYILGYMLPITIIALAQAIILYVIGFSIGLDISINVLISIPFLGLISIMFISFGLLLGSLLRDQQVGPISSILIQVVAFLSGMWFSLDLIGGVFEQIGYILPFAHGVDMVRFILQGEYSEIWYAFAIISIYTVVITFLAIKVFKKNMKS